MIHPSGNLSTEEYINGLYSTDPAVLTSIYVEFRAPVVRAITALGGSEADGGIFFRAGVVEAAKQVDAGEFLEDEPFFFQVRELALAHYRDWLAERLADDTPSPEAEATASKSVKAGEWPNEETPESKAQAGATPSLEADQQVEKGQTSNFQPPTSEALRLTRRSIYAWRHLEQLDAHSQHQVLAAVALPDPTDDEPAQDEASAEHPFQPAAPVLPEADEPVGNPLTNPAIQQYLSLLKLPLTTSTDLPDWLLHALRNTDGYHFWQKTQRLERKIANREPLHPAAPAPANRWLPRVLLTLAALLLLSWGYNYFFRSAAPREVYQENFQPPASILDDLQSRQSADTMSLGPLPERPRACAEMLQQADANYREKDYAAAGEVLYRIADDPSLAPCHSDAWFYLGIIGLHLNDPGTTLQSFAKIDNLDRFGEDIYWYQALAFVKLAEQQPALRDKAVRAVERAVGATQKPERQARAKEMLEQLGGSPQ